MPSVVSLCGILLVGADIQWKKKVESVGPYEHGFDVCLGQLICSYFDLDELVSYKFAH